MNRWLAVGLLLGLVGAACRAAVAAGPPPLETGALEERIAAGPRVADLLAFAYQHNPTIEAARHAWQAKVEGYRVGTGYPDPQLMVTYFPEPIETRLGPQDWNATLSQQIPFPGKLSKAGELAEADARMAKLALDKAVREVVVAIRESAFELAYLRDAKRVVAHTQELLDHMRKLAESAYGDDRAAFVDVAKAQSQVAQVRYDALLLEELQETERAQLNALLNRAPSAPIGSLAEEPLPTLAYSLEEIYPLARDSQEEIRMAEVQVDKARSRVDLAGYDNLPDFRVGLFYAGIGDHPDVPPAMRPDDAGRDAVGIQAGLSIPLWFGKNRGRSAGARAELETAKALRTAQVNDTSAKIRALYFRLKNAERLVSLYRDELLPQAARALEVAETWFREGEGSFSDFVETESAYYNFQLSLARARADYGKCLARLERVAGANLTRRGPSGGEEASR